MLRAASGDGGKFSSPTTPTLTCLRANRFRLLSAAMKSPLFDTRLVARNLERAYEAMWEQRALGLPPSHIGTHGTPIEEGVKTSRDVLRVNKGQGPLPCCFSD